MLRATRTGPAQKRVLQALEDHAWHDEQELRLTARYARRWIEELRRDGVPIEEWGGRYRLRIAPNPSVSER
jgi:hypothetical protein